jgi:PhoH-like ATPase
MKKTILIDTNLLLDDANVIYKLSKEYERILIPLTVLKELDNKKYNPDLSYSARNAIKSILQFKEKHPDKIIFHVGDSEISGPDAQIINSAINNEAEIATKDVSMSIIAEAKKVKTKLYDTVPNGLFNPYVYINHKKLYVDEDVFAYNQTYENNEYKKIFNLFCEVSKQKLNKDAWFFIFINVETENPVIYAHNPLDKVFDRIDNKPRYKKFTIDNNTLVKALDSYQNCAMYAMVKAPNTLVCGSYGSGKSLLSTAYALAYNDGKTFISRPNLTVDRRFELGYLPGPITDKLTPWMAGVISGLYHIFSNTKGQISDKMMEDYTYDFVKETIFRKHFEMIPLETMQGISFLDGDLLLLDETQLCSISILSIILSRFGKGSKLIATGDVKQTYGTISTSESGLIKLLRLLPSKHMAYVELKYNYRSGLLELADGLQNKTLW